MNCLHSFRTKTKLESHKKVCENKDLCGAIIPSEDTKILEFNKHRKSDKTPSIIYADFESLIKRVDGCKNNFEKSSTTEIGKHIPCEYSMSMMQTFDGIENKHDVYRGEDCLRDFFESLRQHIMKIINFEKKKIVPLTKEQKESCEKTKIYYICKNSTNNDRNYHKTKDHCHYTVKHRGTEHSLKCSLKFKRNSCDLSQLIELRLSFYHKITSKRV